jgi:hypothetical protein
MSLSVVTASSPSPSRDASFANSRKSKLRLCGGAEIDRHAQALSEEDLGAIADRGSVMARELKVQLQNDPDRYAETVSASIKSDMVRTIVAPLVAKLEGALARARGDAFEGCTTSRRSWGSV